MKPELLKVSVGPLNSFSIRKDVLPYFYNRWHYHPEVELIHIEKGTGTQFMGDNIGRFRDGDLLLVGSNLPHYWRCDDIYFEKDSQLRVAATVTHFRVDFLGQHFFELPESKHLIEVLRQACLGIRLDEKTAGAVRVMLNEMLAASGLDRILLLLNALQRIAQSRDLEVLSTRGFQREFAIEETDRINRIYAYSLENFKGEISLEQIASVACMSRNSFCRYFKNRTRKTYSKFLHELRIGFACKLLIDDKLTTSQICHEAGFNNFTNFHRYFKDITGKTPAQYKKEYKYAGVKS
jgi:AraC-like DNA-binding protein